MGGGQVSVQTVGTLVGVAGSQQRGDELCARTKFMPLPGAHLLAVLKVYILQMEFNHDP